MSEPNLMDSIENPNGHVKVRLCPNNFSKDSSDKYVGRTVRNTHTVGNVLQLIQNRIPQIDIGTIYSVCDALEKTVVESLSQGNSVSCLNLGTFYIACKGTSDGNTSISEVLVRFAAGDSLKKSLANISVSQDGYLAPKGLISEIIDVDTSASDGTLTLGGSAKILGRRLRIGGEDSGIWFAPLLDDGKSIDKGGAGWSKVSAKLVTNNPSELLFPLPKGLAAGKYRIVLKSKCDTSFAYERRDMLTTVSDTVTVKELAADD